MKIIFTQNVLGKNYNRFLDKETPSARRFMLYEGEKKIEVKIEVNVSDAALCTLNRANHTLGNILKTQLLRDPKVRVHDIYLMSHTSWLIVNES